MKSTAATEWLTHFTWFESRSTSQTSSGNKKPFLYMRKLDGMPMMNGVGTISS